MKTLGLIGYPLSHSHSADYFTKKFQETGISEEWNYKLFPLKNIDEFTMLVEYTPRLFGLNVTLPHKTSVIKFLDSVTEEANTIGAVNCIEFKDGKSIGHNTDIVGFEKGIKSLKLNANIPALILGNGGASKAVQYYFRKKKISFLIAGRSGYFNLEYKDISPEILKDFPMVINTTPIGMAPNILEVPPIDMNLIGKENICIDLIYNPVKTAFLKKAEENGAKILNGETMFQAQAEAAWKIWNK